MSFARFRLVQHNWSWKRVALGALPVTAFGLGTWQIQRWKWKVRLIEDMETKLARDAIVLPSTIRPERVDAYHCTKFLVQGRWVHEDEMYLGPRTREGKIG